MASKATRLSKEDLADIVELVRKYDGEQVRERRPVRQKATTLASLVEEHESVKNLGICQDPLIWCVHVSEKTCCCCLRMASGFAAVCKYIFVLVMAMLLMFALWNYFFPAVQSTTGFVASLFTEVAKRQALAEMTAKVSSADEESVQRARTRPLVPGQDPFVP